ncbi:protein nrt1/ ptr family 4.3, partial [Quercus suber]
KPELVEGKVDWKGRTAVKGKHGGARTALLVLAPFGFENMATLALAVNLTTYFNLVMHLELADAANELTNFLGASYILSILVAILADTYIGRYKAVLIGGCLELVALVLLVIQAHYPKLKPPPCNVFDPTSHCEKIGGISAVLLYVALYLLAAGSAGMKAVLPSHGADQFDERTQKKKADVQLLQLPSISSILTLNVWIQDHKGWDWGFGISSIAILFAIIVFAIGLPMYRIQVYVAAIRNRNLDLPEDLTKLYEIDHDHEAAMETEFLPHRDIFRFLDKAAIQHGNLEEAPNPWKLCRVTQVENAKIILGVLPIFCCTIIMTLCVAQLQTFSVQQGLTMDTSISKSFHIPPASLPIIPILFIIIIIPVYDRIFVPLAHKITGIPNGITHLQRIGVGLILSCISMTVAGFMEVKRKGVARDHNMLDAIPLRGTGTGLPILNEKAKRHEEKNT